MKTPFVILLLLLPLFLLGQNNLVPNPGFENGATPQPSNCNYITITPLSTRVDAFDDDVDNWFVAKHHNHRGYDVGNYLDVDIHDCLLEYWASCASNIFPQESALPSRRFVDIYARYRGRKQPPKSLKKYEHCAIRAQLNEVLDIGATYILRIKFISLAKNQQQSWHTFSGQNHLRIHFTKWGHHWNSPSNNNQKLNDAVTIVRTNPGFSCEWEFVEATFTVPNNNDFNDLKNIILYVEEGRFIVDDIVVFKQCPNEMLVENTLYDLWFYNPAHSNVVFSNNAANTLKAGRSVDPNKVDGPVIVEANADVTFRAGTRIELLPGFRTELGAKFVAEIAPCITTNKTGPTVEPPVAEFEEFMPELPNPVSEREFQVYPNPNSGQFTLVLPKETHATARVFDMLGNVVYSAHLFGRQQSGIDISAMSKGIYFLHASQGDQVFTEKIIIR